MLAVKQSFLLKRVQIVTNTREILHVVEAYCVNLSNEYERN